VFVPAGEHLDSAMLSYQLISSSAGSRVTTSHNPAMLNRIQIQKNVIQKMRALVIFTVVHDKKY
jgi:hypothetical protein